MLPEEDWAMSIGNMHKILVKFGHAERKWGGTLAGRDENGRVCAIK